MIDRFSKLVSLVPLTKQDELSVAEAIKDHWLYKFGKPKSILSDRGRVFEGSILRKLTEKFGIKQEFTSPYQHQANGLAERAIRTVRDMLITSLKSKKEKIAWEKMIPKIEFSINATYQSSTKRSPFEIVFGRKVILHGLPPSSSTDHERIILETKFESGKAADKLRNLEASRRGHRDFQIGEKVLVKKEPHNMKKNGNRYDGPFQILEFLSPHQVLIDFPGKPKPRRIEWLKRILNSNGEGS